MKLFSPGDEDSFRLLTIPDTFYLRYYPDRSMIKNDKISVLLNIAKWKRTSR